MVLVLFCTFNAVVRHEKHSHAISASGNYSYNSVAAVRSSLRVSPLSHMHPVAAQRPSVFPMSPADQPQLVEKPVSLLMVCMYTRRAALLPSCARSWRGAAFCTSSYIFISSPLFRPRLRSVRVLRARSTSNLRLRNIGRRQLSLHLPNRIRNSPA